MTGAEFDHHPEYGHDHVGEWARFLPKLTRIPWAFIDSNEPWSKLVGSREKLEATLRSSLPDALYERLRVAPVLVLIRKAKSTADGKPELLCLRRPVDVDKLHLLEVIHDTPADALFQRVALSGREQLAKETVIIVGLGSLGGAIALAIARAGVRRFVLVDPDTLSLENVCRRPSEPASRSSTPPRSGVLPGQSPCFECIVTAQDEDPSSYPRFISQGTDRERQPAYLTPELPGLGVDVTELAMLTARFALQTIARVRGVDLGVPLEDGDHLLWTSRGDWLFDRPLQLIVERFPRSPSCPVCGQSKQAPEDLDDADGKELAVLLAKLRRR